MSLSNVAIQSGVFATSRPSLHFYFPGISASLAPLGLGLMIVAGADPGGGPGGPGPPLTLGFEAPKLSIFGPYLIFP